VPVIVSQIYNDRNEHWERLIFIGLEDIEEIVIFEEAHCPVSNLQMNSTNASDYSFKELWNQMLYFIYLANFKNLLKFCQEEGLLNAVGERPVL